MSKLKQLELDLKLKNLIKDFDNFYNSNYHEPKISKSIELSLEQQIKQIEDPKLRNLFKDLINKTYKKGQIYKLIKEKGFDLNIVYRTKKKLGLKNFDKSIVRQNLETEIIEKYTLNKLSTLEIGKIYGFSSHNIRNILKKNNITLRPAHITNPSRFPLKNLKMSPEELKDIIYTKYLIQKKKIYIIADELGIDAQSLGSRIKSYGWEVKSKRPKSKNKFKCAFCGKIDYSQCGGARQQQFCSSSCKNKIKDLRRNRFTPKQTQLHLQRIKNTWGLEYEQKLQELKISPTYL